MNETLGRSDYMDLEASMRDLATALEWPRTPDLVTAVGPRLAPNQQQTGWSVRGLFRPHLTRALLLAALLALLVAGAAVGLRFGLDLLQIQFGPGPTLTAAPTTAFGRPLGLGSRTDIESAVAGAAFPVVVPADPGLPSEVYRGGSNLRGQIAFIYAPSDTLPASDYLDGAGLLITQNAGSIDAGLARKVVMNGGTVESTMVGDTRAYWFAGAPHWFWYLDAEGRVIDAGARRVGNTLAWQRGNVLFRIEGDISLERAIEIAESLP